MRVVLPRTFGVYSLKRVEAKFAMAKKLDFDVDFSSDEET
jgi:hypothetical protein